MSTSFYDDDAALDRAAAAIGMAAVKYADLSRKPSDDYKFSFDHMLAMAGDTAPYILYAHTRARSLVQRGKRRLQEEQQGEQQGEQQEQQEQQEQEKGRLTTSGSGSGRDESKGGGIIIAAAPIRLEHPSELLLARELVRLQDAVADAENELSPQRICAFAYSTSTAFSRFYESCPVIVVGGGGDGEGEGTRPAGGDGGKEEDRKSLAATSASRLALCELTGRTLEFALGLLGIRVPEGM